MNEMASHYEPEVSEQCGQPMYSFMKNGCVYYVTEEEWNRLQLWPRLPKLPNWWERRRAAFLHRWFNIYYTGPQKPR